MHYVYVLKSVNHYRFYVGMTQNLKRRLLEHNSGRSKSTKPYRPWELFFFESFHTRKDARNKEKYFKGGSGKELIKQKWFDINQ